VTPQAYNASQKLSGAARKEARELAHTLHIPVAAVKAKPYQEKVKEEKRLRKEGRSVVPARKPSTPKKPRMSIEGLRSFAALRMWDIARDRGVRWEDNQKTLAQTIPHMTRAELEWTVAETTTSIDIRRKGMHPPDEAFDLNVFWYR
jgi:hypothetical protein